MDSLQSPIDPLFFALQEALAGKYSLESELGRGGMGVVYLAQDVQLDRPVALKVLPQEFAARTEVRDRFLHEARTAAKLSHPNIVPIFAVDEVGEFVYYVMAYVAGETLGQRVQSRGPLPPSESARVLKEIGWALAYAHSQGVVHRDIKPDNILLEEGSGRALVVDFGIAGLLGDVPSVARQLESDAQRLRQTLEMLNDAHAAARAAGSDIPSDLQEAREKTEQHLAEAVASLETIRLGLLRLTTGVGTVQSFTTDLSAAAEVGDRIDRLMDGMGDVELLLRPT